MQNAMKRDDLLFQTLASLGLKHSSWLDVGAGDGLVSLQLRKMLEPCFFRCLDVRRATHNVRHNIRVENFDGKTFSDMGDKSVSFVLFNFVLHHAAGDTESLLKEAFRVASRAVILQEDVLDGDAQTHRNLKEHDPNGIFRSTNEWLQLLNTLAPRSWKYHWIPHPGPAEDTTFDAPRMLFLSADTYTIYLSVMKELLTKRERSGGNLSSGLESYHASVLSSLYYDLTKEEQDRLEITIKDIK